MTPWGYPRDGFLSDLTENQDGSSSVVATDRMRVSDPRLSEVQLQQYKTSIDRDLNPELVDLNPHLWSKRKSRVTSTEIIRNLQGGIDTSNRVTASLSATRMLSVARGPLCKYLQSGKFRESFPSTPDYFRNR